MRVAGFGTIEAIVAVALFSLMAAAITSTVVLARRLQSSVAAERQATQYATAGLERLRAGGNPRPAETTRGFTITETLQPWNGNARLFEAHVRVTWEDQNPRALELSTLVMR